MCVQRAIRMRAQGLQIPIGAPDADTQAARLWGRRRGPDRQRARSLLVLHAVESRRRRPRAPGGAVPAPHADGQIARAIQPRRAVHLVVVARGVRRPPEAVADPARFPGQGYVRRPLLRVPVASGTLPDDCEAIRAGARVHFPEIAPIVAVGIGALPPHPERADVEFLVTLRLRRRLAQLRGLRRSRHAGIRPRAHPVDRGHPHLVGAPVPQPGYGLPAGKIGGLPRHRAPRPPRLTVTHAVSGHRRPAVLLDRRLPGQA